MSRLSTAQSLVDVHTYSSVEYGRIDMAIMPGAYGYAMENFGGGNCGPQALAAAIHYADHKCSLSGDELIAAGVAQRALYSSTMTKGSDKYLQVFYFLDGTDGKNTDEYIKEMGAPNGWWTATEVEVMADVHQRCIVLFVLVEKSDPPEYTRHVFGAEFILRATLVGVVYDPVREHWLGIRIVYDTTDGDQEAVAAAATALDVSVASVSSADAPVESEVNPRVAAIFAAAAQVETLGWHHAAMQQADAMRHAAMERAAAMELAVAMHHAALEHATEHAHWVARTVAAAAVPLSAPPPQADLAPDASPDPVGEPADGRHNVVSQPAAPPSEAEVPAACIPAPAAAVASPAHERASKTKQPTATAASKPSASFGAAAPRLATQHASAPRKAPQPSRHVAGKAPSGAPASITEAADESPPSPGAAGAPVPAQAVAAPEPPAPVPATACEPMSALFKADVFTIDAGAFPPSLAEMDASVVAEAAAKEVATVARVEALRATVKAGAAKSAAAGTDKAQPKAATLQLTATSASCAAQQRQLGARAELLARKRAASPGTVPAAALDFNKKIPTRHELLEVIPGKIVGPVPPKPPPQPKPQPVALQALQRTAPQKKQKKKAAAFAPAAKAPAAAATRLATASAARAGAVGAMFRAAAAKGDVATQPAGAAKGAAAKLGAAAAAEAAKADEPVKVDAAVVAKAKAKANAKAAKAAMAAKAAAEANAAAAAAAKAAADAAAAKPPSEAALDAAKAAVLAGEVDPAAAEAHKKSQKRQVARARAATLKSKQLKQKIHDRARARDARAEAARQRFLAERALRTRRNEAIDNNPVFAEDTRQQQSTPDAELPWSVEAEAAADKQSRKIAAAGEPKLVALVVKRPVDAAQHAEQAGAAATAVEAMATAKKAEADVASATEAAAAEAAAAEVDATVDQVVAKVAAEVEKAHNEAAATVGVCDGVFVGVCDGVSHGDGVFVPASGDGNDSISNHIPACGAGARSRCTSPDVARPVPKATCAFATLARHSLNGRCMLPGKQLGFMSALYSATPLRVRGGSAMESDSGTESEPVEPTWYAIDDEKDLLEQVRSPAGCVVRLKSNHNAVFRLVERDPTPFRTRFERITRAYSGKALRFTVYYFKELQKEYEYTSLDASGLRLDFLEEEEEEGMATTLPAPPPTWSAFEAGVDAKNWYLLQVTDEDTAFLVRQKLNHALTGELSFTDAGYALKAPGGLEVQLTFAELEREYEWRVASKEAVPPPLGAAYQQLTPLQQSISPLLETWNAFDRLERGRIPCGVSGIGMKCLSFSLAHAAQLPGGDTVDDINFIKCEQAVREHLEPTVKVLVEAVRSSWLQWITFTDELEVDLNRIEETGILSDTAGASLRAQMQGIAVARLACAAVESAALIYLTGTRPARDASETERVEKAKGSWVIVPHDVAYRCSQNPDLETLAYFCTSEEEAFNWYHGLHVGRPMPQRTARVMVLGYDTESQHYFSTRSAAEGLHMQQVDRQMYVDDHGEAAYPAFAAEDAWKATATLDPGRMPMAVRGMGLLSLSIAIAHQANLEGGDVVDESGYLCGESAVRDHLQPRVAVVAAEHGDNWIQISGTAAIIHDAENLLSTNRGVVSGPIHSIPALKAACVALEKDALAYFSCDDPEWCFWFAVSCDPDHYAKEYEGTPFAFGYRFAMQEGAFDWYHSGTDIPGANDGSPSLLPARSEDVMVLVFDARTGEWLGTEVPDAAMEVEQPEYEEGVWYECGEHDSTILELGRMPWAARRVDGLNAGKLSVNFSDKSRIRFKISYAGNKVELIPDFEKLKNEYEITPFHLSGLNPADFDDTVPDFDEHYRGIVRDIMAAPDVWMALDTLETGSVKREPVAVASAGLRRLAYSVANQAKLSGGDEVNEIGFISCEAAVREHLLPGVQAVASQYADEWPSWLGIDRAVERVDAASLANLFSTDPGAFNPGIGDRVHGTATLRAACTYLKQSALVYYASEDGAPGRWFAVTHHPDHRVIDPQRTERHEYWFRNEKELTRWYHEQNYRVVKSKDDDTVFLPARSTDRVLVLVYTPQTHQYNSTTIVDMASRALANAVTAGEATTATPTATPADTTMEPSPPGSPDEIVRKLKAMRLDPTAASAFPGINIAHPSQLARLEQREGASPTGGAPAGAKHADAAEVGKRAKRQDLLPPKRLFASRPFATASGPWPLAVPMRPRLKPLPVVSTLESDDVLDEDEPNAPLIPDDVLDEDDLAGFSAEPPTGLTRVYDKQLPDWAVKVAQDAHERFCTPLQLGVDVVTLLRPLDSRPDAAGTPATTPREKLALMYKAASALPVKVYERFLDYLIGEDILTVELFNGLYERGIMPVRHTLASIDVARKQGLLQGDKVVVVVGGLLMHGTKELIHSCKDVVNIEPAHKLAETAGTLATGITFAPQPGLLTETIPPLEGETVDAVVYPDIFYIEERPSDIKGMLVNHLNDIGETGGMFIVSWTSAMAVHHRPVLDVLNEAQRLHLGTLTKQVDVRGGAGKTLLCYSFVAHKANTVEQYKQRMEMLRGFKMAALPQQNVYPARVGSTSNYELNLNKPVAGEPPAFVVNFPTATSSVSRPGVYLIMLYDESGTMFAFYIGSSIAAENRVMQHINALRGGSGGVADAIPNAKSYSVHCLFDGADIHPSILDALTMDTDPSDLAGSRCHLSLVVFILRLVEQLAVASGLCRDLKRCVNRSFSTFQTGIVEDVMASRVDLLLKLGAQASDEALRKELSDFAPETNIPRIRLLRELQRRGCASNDELKRLQDAFMKQKLVVVFKGGPAAMHEYNSMSTEDQEAVRRAVDDLITISAPRTPAEFLAFSHLTKTVRDAEVARLRADHKLKSAFKSGPAEYNAMSIEDKKAVRQAAHELEGLSTRTPAEFLAFSRLTKPTRDAEVARLRADHKLKSAFTGGPAAMIEYNAMSTEDKEAVRNIILTGNFFTLTRMTPTDWLATSKKGAEEKRILRVTASAEHGALTLSTVRCQLAPNKPVLHIHRLRLIDESIQKMRAGLESKKKVFGVYACSRGSHCLGGNYGKLPFLQPTKPFDKRKRHNAPRIEVPTGDETSRRQNTCSGPLLPVSVDQARHFLSLPEIDEIATLVRQKDAKIKDTAKAKTARAKKGRSRK